jgi:hypothetical protein
MKKRTVTYSAEPSTDGWAFDANAKPLNPRQLEHLGLADNDPSGTEYERSEKSGIVALRPTRGGPRQGAGRKSTGNVRLQLLVAPATREKIEAIAAREKITLSEAVSRVIANA